jgi:NTE family protein
MSNELTAIVLQGGGALGAYEFVALKAFFERPGFGAHVIIGVSIGALAAAVLVGARRDPIVTLGEMWERFSSPLCPRCQEWTHG